MTVGVRIYKEEGSQGQYKTGKTQEMGKYFAGG